MHRRTVLATGAAFVTLPLARNLRAETLPTLTAAPARVQLAPAGYPQTRVWAYDGSIPGPEIRVTQGARVTRRLVNDLPQPTAVHWHGIRIDNAMDGVPDLTQKAVPPGGSFDYDFIAPDAGTYWYHTHNRSWEQLGRGLAGPLIVEETGGPEVDRDLTLMISDWRIDEDAALTEDFGAMHDFAHAGRLGNLLTVNGAFEPRIPVRQGERLRLRLINAATARILALGWHGMTGAVVALDGAPLDTPDPETRRVLAPAQRADLILDVTAAPGAEAFMLQIAQDGGYALASFPVETGTSAARGPVQPLPPQGWTEPDLGHARTLDLRMQGGAMRGLPEGATHMGQAMSMRELMQVGMIWSMNGTAGMTETPLFTLDRGESFRMPLINDTAFAHGIHLHGHHFRELRDGVPGPWRDTALIRPGETTEIALVGENPGDWLLHCHMLGHQASGMKSWFRVT